MSGGYWIAILALTCLVLLLVVPPAIRRRELRRRLERINVAVVRVTVLELLKRFEAEGLTRESTPEVRDAMARHPSAVRRRHDRG